MESILQTALGQESSQATVTEKRHLLERLLARLAHEIRNPLSSLDIHVQLLEEDLAELPFATRAELMSHLEIIHGELHRLESIVQHFLKLAGPSALNFEPVELSRIVSHVCNLLRPEAAARQIEIVAERAEQIPITMADPVRLTQALMNLVINAMQAVERNGRIEVKIAIDLAGILLVVQDNGPGIAAEKLGSIFDPYFTTKAEGSGLGLWIAQQIATAHGGTLQAQNGPARGAVFTLMLPIRPEAAQKPNLESA